MRRLGITLALVFIALPAVAQEQPEPAPEPAPAPAPEPAPPPPPPAKPSILIDAKDEMGKDVRSVTVFVDDKPIAYELTGTPIELEPGAHTIALQRNDGPRQRATATVTLGEGEVNHAVHLAFEKPAEPATALPPPDNAPIASRIVAGVGVVAVVTGVVLLLARPSLPTNCNSDTYKCIRLPAETDAKFAEERSDAATNRDLLHAGLATLLSGAGVAAAGVLWYVLEMPKPRTATVVAPWLLPRMGNVDAGGVMLRASF